jgi:hypothetical protein
VSTVPTVSLWQAGHTVVPENGDRALGRHGQERMDEERADDLHRLWHAYARRHLMMTSPDNTVGGHPISDPKFTFLLCWNLVNAIARRICHCTLLRITAFAWTVVAWSLQPSRTKYTPRIELLLVVILDRSNTYFGILGMDIRISVIQNILILIIIFKDPAPNLNVSNLSFPVTNLTISFYCTRSIATSD